MKTIKNLLKFITFVFITLFLVLKSNNIFILERYAHTRIAAFHNMPKNSLDVLMIGDSSLMNSVSPMELWAKNGIASFNYSVNSGRIHTIYYWIQDALKYQKPQLIIIDPATLFYPNDKYVEEAKREFVDYIEKFDIKFKIIKDNIYSETLYDKASILFPLLRYHDRWKDMDLSVLANLNKEYTDPYRGFSLSSAVKPNYKGNQYMEKSKDNVKMMDMYKDYLDKTIDLCQKNGIKLLILGVQDIRVWGPEESKILNEIVKEKEIDFLDLNSIDYGLNWLQDSRDGGGHLNTQGALKVTDYLSNYLKENYNIPSRKGQKGYEFWDEDYKIYEKSKQESLKYLEANLRRLGLDDASQNNKEK